MLFNSFAFIFLFLPLSLLLYFILSKNKNPFYQQLWLSLASFFFYACWNKLYLILLLSSVCINFAFAQQLMQKKDKMMLGVAIFFNIAVLIYFKYMGFFVDNLSWLFNSSFSIQKIALPLGISFITFQKITYIVDVYRGKVKNNDFLAYLVYISFFPQLIAGPIVHYNQIMPQFSSRQPKRFKYINFNLGMSLFMVGLAKKVIFADTAATYSDPVFAALEQGIGLTFQETWVGVLAYTFQIYFDFSGYSDMAIGLARMFGVRLPINFNSPYKAASIIQFWRCWHMTLSRFLRDYVYIPLGGNRCSPFRKQINLLATMLIGGLWHGANWTFVIWGGLHGSYLILNHLWVHLCSKLGWRKLPTLTIYKYAMQLVTFIAVVFAWVFFRSPNFHTAQTAMHGLLGKHGFGIPITSYLHNMPFLYYLQTYLGIEKGNGLTILGTVFYLWLMLMMVWLLPNSQELMRMMRWRAISKLKILIWRPNVIHFFYTVGLFYVNLGIMFNFTIKPFEYFAF